MREEGRGAVGKKGEAGLGTTIPPISERTDGQLACMTSPVMHHGRNGLF